EIAEVPPLVDMELRHVAYDVRDPGQGHSFGHKLEMTARVTEVSNLLQIDRALNGDCAGGSGGPAYVEQNGVERIAAIVSWDIATCERPSFHVRVDTHVVWIEQTIEAW